MQSLESAAFAAWPSETSESFRGWQLRLDRGYTKRANSVNATDAAQPLSDRDIDAVERRFRERGLAPVFRLPSFARVADTDARLADRGYRWVEPSLVMTRTLQGIEDAAEPTLAADAERWLRAFQTVSGKTGTDQATHLAILRRIAPPRAWALDRPGDSPRCCGRAVVVDGTVGLFDIATRADRQRRGLARGLCLGLLAWGVRHGARTAFLQVVAANTPAIRLYRRMGFDVAYEYGYRVLPAGTG